RWAQASPLSLRAASRRKTLPRLSALCGRTPWTHRAGWNPPRERRIMTEFAPSSTTQKHPWPDARGRYGGFGGRFVPETLMYALDERGGAYSAGRADAASDAALDALRKRYIGREPPLYHARRLTGHLGGATIYFKREELAHTGAHKINNALGQCLLAKRMGKT